MTNEPQPADDQAIDDLLDQARDAVAQMIDGPSAAYPSGGQPRRSSDQSCDASDAGQSGRPAAETETDGKSASTSDPAGGQPTTVEDAAIDDLQALLRQAEKAIAPADHALRHELEPFEFTDFSAVDSAQDDSRMELLREVELDLRIEFGRTELTPEDVDKLRRGAVVALDNSAEDPVDVYVNGRLVARGNVFVMNDNFCVRVTELIPADEDD